MVRITLRRISFQAQDGFTMIEVLVVTALVVILATVSMPQYRNAVTYAQEATLKEDLFRMRDVINQFYADKGRWPADLNELVSERYIREVPVDPITKSKTTWQARQAELDVNNPAATAGIDDVTSGSDRTALDGTRYADWD